MLFLLRITETPHKVCLKPIVSQNNTKAHLKCSKCLIKLVNNKPVNNYSNRREKKLKKIRKKIQNKNQQNRKLKIKKYRPNNRKTPWKKEKRKNVKKQKQIHFLICAIFLTSPLDVAVIYFKFIQIFRQCFYVTTVL